MTIHRIATAGQAAVPMAAIDGPAVTRQAAAGPNPGPAAVLSVARIADLPREDALRLQIRGCTALPRGLSLHAGSSGAR